MSSSHGSTVGPGEDRATALGQANARRDENDRFAGPALHPRVSTAFTSLSAHLSAGEMLSIIEGRNPEDVVIIRRVVQGEPLFYIRSCYELRRRLHGRNPFESVETVLDLHETTSTPKVSPTQAEKGLRSGTLADQPTVVIDDGHAVGFFGFVVYLTKAKKPSDGPTEIFLHQVGGEEDRGGLASDSPEPTVPGMTRRGMDEGEDAEGAEPMVEAPPPAQPDVTPPPPCYFGARMPETVPAGNQQQVQVTISCEAVAAVAGTASGQGSAPLGAGNRKITVRLIPKRNFEVVGDFRCDVASPAPGEDAVELYFDVKPTAAGEGEIWVAFCQGALSLVTLKLKPQIVSEQATGADQVVAGGLTTPAAEVAPENVMHVIRTQSDGSVRYRYWLCLAAAKIDDDYESPPFSDDTISLLKPYMNLFDKVEAETAADFDQLQLQLRSIGARLFQTLFPPDLQRVFWENRDNITHLKFYCEEPAIPWELLHVCEPGKPLPSETKHLGQMGLVRWLSGHAAPRQLRIRPGRARYVTPSYPGKELKSAKKEGELLKDLFAAAPVLPATRPEVTKLLTPKGPFDLFHFAGHGQASEGQITDSLLELDAAAPGASSQLRDLTPDIVAGLCDLKAEDGTQAIVVLNSCRTGKVGRYVTGLGGFAPAFLEREAGLFVGALWMIGDEPASAFIEAFYRSLHDGKCVADAVVAAREKARSESDATYLAYVVYGDPLARLVA